MCIQELCLFCLDLKRFAVDAQNACKASEYLMIVIIAHVHSNILELCHLQMVDPSLVSIYFSEAIVFEGHYHSG